LDWVFAAGGFFGQTKPISDKQFVINCMEALLGAAAAKGCGGFIILLSRINVPNILGANGAGADGQANSAPELLAYDHISTTRLENR
jgi:hypothetical protein